MLTFVCPASHLDGRLLVVLVLGQAASPQHKVALVPVLHQTPLLFLEPAGLQGPLHGPGGANGAGASVPLPWHHALGPGWNATKPCLVKKLPKKSSHLFLFIFFSFFVAEPAGFLR